MSKTLGEEQVQLSDRYDPQEVEERIYDWWEKSGYFKAENVSSKPPYSIILPPPNVTGALHLGHALDHTIQDVLIRWKRMSGFNALWLPGTDHAGIATQVVVEKALSKDEKKTRHDLGREKFVEKVWKWKKESGGKITQQMRRLGNSCDWDRETFTLDDEVSKAVRKVFTTLYDKKLIYKGQRLVSWSPPLESAISDLEVIHKEINGNLWHIQYPLVKEEGVGAGVEYLTVATTRPETLLGDSAVCVHPEDERYKGFVGKKVRLPLVDRLIPVIADRYVDKDFGSGVVKITPAHDFNDYEVGLRHDLELINILEKNGTLNDRAGSYQGLKVQEARKQIVKDLENKNFLEKVEPYKTSVGHCDRSGAVVEPYLSEQWFVKTNNLAKPAKNVVESGTLRFEPESWTKTYLHWMNNIQDWCISRQLWWGHRIPAFYCQSCEHLMVKENDPSECEECGGSDLKQDQDVLDTWFSSALWPFSTMGWPEETETQKTFYPTDILVTGHDIIFFWVARMVMAGLEFKGEIPFKTVYIHGLIRDSQGKKMSKSVGNAVDPLKVIDNHGADALRYTLMASISGGRDLKFSEQRLEGYRNFMNKIWNASRFALKALDGFKISNEDEPSRSGLSSYDKWILKKLADVENRVHKSLTEMNFSDAASALYSFTWYDFCDWYLEFIKPIIYREENSAEKNATQFVLIHTLNRILRLLHPFAPFITEEIYSKLPVRGEAIIIDDYPNLQNDQKLLSLGCEKEAVNVDLVKEVILALRNIRGENRIKPSDKIEGIFMTETSHGQKILDENRVSIIRLAGLRSYKISQREELKKCAMSTVAIGKDRVTVAVPLEGLVDFDEEIKRIEKNIERTEKDIGVLEKKLSNERFVANAPKELVAADKKLLEQHNAKVEALRANLRRFK